MIRLFTAIAISGEPGAALAACQTGLREARWRPLETLHLTLRFFGEVDERRAEDLALALAEAVIPPFELSLSGVGYFGEGDQIRAIWAGLADSEPLRRLAARCESAARRAGLSPDSRNFMPHVTLAYLKRPNPTLVGAWIAAQSLLKSEPFSVSRFGLYSSWPGEQGSRYELERFYNLG